MLHDTSTAVAVEAHLRNCCCLRFQIRIHFADHAARALAVAMHRKHGETKNRVFVLLSIFFHLSGLKPTTKLDFVEDFQNNNGWAQKNCRAENER